MTNNPYAPPTAPVSDVSESAPVESRDVARACKLLWACFWIQQVASTADVVLFVDMLAVFAVVSILAFALAFLITRWVVSKLMQRRNWMRILLTLLTVVLLLTTLMFWGRLTPGYAGSTSIEKLSLALQVVLYSVAVGFLFTARSRAWFAQRAGIDEQPS